ncbi:unnamed protein product [Mytilus coruscus]|uniref:Uncharacterized protein n=1 Tax=Mytilus coruscus TaxID=42192 RepID=A0A6J8C8T9_MYTCO|nr:unnamed protein product [Mytilus coruscus]
MNKVAENGKDSNPNKRKRTGTETTTTNVTNANEQRQRVSEDNVAIFRTYRELNVKLINGQQHYQYSNKCLSRDIVPKTLRSTIQPQVPDTTPKFPRHWEQAQLNHGRSLVKLLANYWEDRCQKNYGTDRRIETRTRGVNRDRNGAHNPINRINEIIRRKRNK